MIFRLLLIGATLTMSGCGVVYISSTVSESAGDGPVDVIEMTPSTVAAANRAAYSPQELPAAFSRIAGGGGVPSSDATLPDRIFDAEIRPGDLQMTLPPEANPGPYMIGVGDVLTLTTPQGEATPEELAGIIASQGQREGYTVQEDGAISVPDVGRVMVAGMTAEEAEDALFNRFIEARLEPSFSVEITGFNSKRVTIGGAVEQPGVVPVTIVPLRLGEVLAQVGGLSVENPEYTVVRLLREGELYQIPLTEVLTDEDVADTRLVAGDSLYVDVVYDFERAQAFFQEQISRENYTRQARQNAIADLQQEMSIYRASLDESRANFRARMEFGAEGHDHVYLLGEVERNGRFPLPFESHATLADALFDAGGVRRGTGNPRQIYVLRGAQAADGTETVNAYQLDGSDAANFLLATRFELRPHDVIFVAEQPISRWNRVLSQLTPSLDTINRTSAIADD